MAISSIANRVESAIKVADALGKTEAEVKADVHAIVSGLPLADMKAVEAYIADSVANDQR